MKKEATRAEVFAAIESERRYQDKVWPEGAPSVGDSILLVEEYALKARAAWATEAAPEMEALDIMRKIAGIAVRCMEVHGAPQRAGFEVEAG